MLDQPQPWAEDTCCESITWTEWDAGSQDAGSLSMLVERLVLG